MADFKPKKFLVVPTKYLTSKTINDIVDQLVCALEEKGYNIHSKYYVCNQDEPYAGKVLDVILGGENDKLVQEGIADLQVMDPGIARKIVEGYRPLPIAEKE